MARIAASAPASTPVKYLFMDHPFADPATLSGRRQVTIGAAGPNHHDQTPMNWR